MSEASPEKLMAWQREGEAVSNWATLRVPFFIILVSAGAFFLFRSQSSITQPWLLFLRSQPECLLSLSSLSLFQARVSSAVGQ